MKQSLFLTLRSLVSHGGQFRSRPAGPGYAPGQGRPGSLYKGRFPTWGRFPRTSQIFDTRARCHARPAWLGWQAWLGWAGLAGLAGLARPQAAEPAQLPALREIRLPSTLRDLASQDSVRSGLPGPCEACQDSVGSGPPALNGMMARARAARPGQPARHGPLYKGRLPTAARSSCT